jgi:very-short-patch-repair endonuclease
MAQVCLGEILAPDAASRDHHDDAFHSINAKRLDFAVFDRRGTLVVAIEYQGTGHFQGTAVQRDAIKRAAVEKAGVPFIEIFPDFVPRDVRRRLEDILRPSSRT